MKQSLTFYMATVVKTLQSGGHFGTAHVYHCALESFISFCRSRNVAFGALTSVRLKHYENHLLNRGLKRNTVSTYMRMLKATYRRAFRERVIGAYNPLLFSDVETSTYACVKRAIHPSAMGHVLTARLGELPESLRATCVRASLMYRFQGMSFADYIHLPFHGLEPGKRLSYERKKTKRPLTVLISEETQALIDEDANTAPSSVYLFPVLEGQPWGSEEAYKTYQRALRSFNRNLARLSEWLNLGVRLSSYTIRHTWATTAFRQKVPVGIISNAMGHSSIRVTETYMKPFEEEEVARINEGIIDYTISQSKLDCIL
ncbi:tyrosine-type recombinase/integrase [Bacteroides hominis]